MMLIVSLVEALYRTNRKLASQVTGETSCDTNIAALQLALGGLPDRMRVEADSDIKISAKTVGELRKITAWPDNLAITTPQDRYLESAARVSKANVATRTSPKP